MTGQSVGRLVHEAENVGQITLLHLKGCRHQKNISPVRSPPLENVKWVWNVGSGSNWVVLAQTLPKHSVCGDDWLVQAEGSLR